MDLILAGSVMAFTTTSWSVPGRSHGVGGRRSPLAALPGTCTCRWPSPREPLPPCCCSATERPESDGCGRLRGESREGSRQPEGPTASPDLARDEEFMRLALQQAELAYEEGEVPVGAVLTMDDGDEGGDKPQSRVVVASTRNAVEGQVDATAHAEIRCLREAATVRGGWRLGRGTTLYTTVEPCAMCMSAIQLSRVDRVVFGAPDLRLGGAGSWVNLLDVGGKPHPYQPQLQVTGGVLAAPAAELMRKFFRARRAERARPPRSVAPLVPSVADAHAE